MTGVIETAAADPAGAMAGDKGEVAINVSVVA